MNLLVAILLTASVGQVLAGFHFKATLDHLEIFLDNRKILEHSPSNPAIEVGHGNARYVDDLGNFEIKEHLADRLVLPKFIVHNDLVSPGSPGDSDQQLARDETFEVEFTTSSANPSVRLAFSSTSGVSLMRVVSVQGGVLNRLWMRLSATEEEHVYGGGEQFSHFSLRGHAYPMWCREQGVGRNKSTTITYLADLIAGAGGDYHTTYWPQPTFVSDRLYFAHVDYSFYSVLNFTSKYHHELEFWEGVENAKVYFGTSSSWKGLLTELTSFLGRQPTPPDWVYNGAILGIQGGTDEVLRKYGELSRSDVRVSAIWIQDWSGKISTSLGKRVYWNWRWDITMYPHLDIEIKKFKAERNIRFLSYINPHVIKDCPLYKEADEQGFFIKSKKTGKTQLVDFGEMECGTVDLTNPGAYEWYKQVLKDMLALGFSGWMADFGGEYLPVDDALFHDGRSSLEMHNLYSELWARLNKEAVEESHKLHDTLIFMRSGFGRSPGYSLVSWGGDQNVDFSYADGLASVVPAALSLGMSGMGIHHSDVGGYLSLICVVRTEELVLRWGEMNIFTPILRTHEGNRPDRNWQVYTTSKTMRAFSRIAELFTLLAPYHRHVAAENAEHGYPAQRPLFFHYPDDPNVWNIKFQYLYGEDILVAPVFLEDRSHWDVYLPQDEWVYLWNGTEISVDSGGKNVRVNAEVGNPPVFYRKRSEWSKLLKKFAPHEAHNPDHSSNLTWNLLWNHPKIFMYLLLRKLFWYVFFNV